MEIRKILIANRGEIACRIQRTCRSMGIATVGVYSDADRNGRHAREADEAVHIGPAAAALSYLDAGRLLDAARRAGADAVHPGYGFLSENAAFARAVREAGLVFIGPTPEAIAAMGDKIAAKEIARKAGVPVVPGYEGPDPAGHAKAVGYPLLVKAAAGGGGKGMRLVRNEKDLAAALEGAAREAQRAFGSGALLLEKYLEKARHVEVQVFGDAHGNVVHLGERECSLQRRHQKIVEECPSPAVSPELRAKMCQAAVALARAIGYQGAGTVELMLDAKGAFYFLEMNTRLQVEHPVTELVTGLDLVRWQIEVAAGKALPLRQEEIPFRGHAIEARLYAEDPVRAFAPASGTIRALALPEGLEGVRVDGGIAAGDRIGIDYDPMLAKISAHGADRAEALARLERALARLTLVGLVTNRDFLVRLLADPDVRRGDFSTGFVEAGLGRWLPSPDHEETALALVAATVHRRLALAKARTGLSTIPPGFRNNPFRYPSAEWRLGDRTLAVSFYAGPGETLHVFAGGSERAVRVIDERQERDGAVLRLEIDGRQCDFSLHTERRHAGSDDEATVHVAFLGHEIALSRAPRFPQATAHGTKGGVRAPMTGRVTRLLKTVGDAVSEGDALLVLEAMKMEQTIVAPEAGKLEAILVREGETVEMGVSLVTIAAPPG